jgi:nitroreductase
MLTPVAKPAVAEVPIAEPMASRWSPRAFDPSRTVEPEKLLALFEAARWAPSSSNEQPWRYMVFDGRNRDARERAESCLAGGNSWAKRAPLLLIACAKRTYTRNGKLNGHAAYDLGAATMALVLQATALGLVAHQMGGFDPEAARTHFAVPDDFSVLTMIAIGYPGEVDLLPPDRRDAELGPRSRKPVAEFVFGDRWPEAVSARTA